MHYIYSYNMYIYRQYNEYGQRPQEPLALHGLSVTRPQGVPGRPDSRCMYDIHLLYVICAIYTLY